MTRNLDSLMEIAGDFDAIVLDQWGVLHDGTHPYPGAIAAVERLRSTMTKIAMLSNSGKRAEVNRDRIAAKGFAPDLFDLVMTSGEALWQDLKHQDATLSLFAMTAVAGDASMWAQGLAVTLVDEISQADAILLMGLPDGVDTAAYRALLDHADGRPIYCTNPDRASPRAGGLTVTSPGALAHAHAAKGGHVIFYGKPHQAVFQSTARALGVAPDRALMVGDSLEHDIAGGHRAGWATAFIEDGLHAGTFAKGDRAAALRGLALEENAPLPDFTLRNLA